MKSIAFVLSLAVLCAAEKVLQTKPGLTKTLQCAVAGSKSTTLDLKWKKNDKFLIGIDRSGMLRRGDKEKRYNLKEEKHLVISNITPRDAALFTCLVNNKEVDKHRLVVASVSVSPSSRLETGSDAVFQCDVYGLPGVTVEWVRPGGRRERTSKLQVTAVTEADSGTWECVFSADGKTMKQNVTLQVTEPRPETTTVTAPKATSAMQDNVTTCADCVVSPSPGPLALLGLSWWVWAAVGGGCLLLLLWVLILVMFNQMKRRKRRFMKMRNGAQLKPKQYCQCPGGPTAGAGRGGRKTTAPPLYAVP